MSIDLNCDMGESFGRYKLGNDAKIIPFVTSVNIACGAHAGDPLVMKRTVELALAHKVQIGAHPGYPDMQGFGRRKMNLSPDEVEAFLLYQIGALDAFVRAAGGSLQHVKPHGALYNQAAQNRSLADAIARAVAAYNSDLILIGLAGSALLKMGEKHGLQVAAEAFPDRGYQANGTLIPRGLPGAVLENVEKIAENAVRLCRKGITVVQGKQEETYSVDTLCIHGDHPDADATAKAISDSLASRLIKVKALSR